MFYLGHVFPQRKCEQKLSAFHFKSKKKTNKILTMIKKTKILLVNFLL